MPSRFMRAGEEHDAQQRQHDGDLVADEHGDARIAPKSEYLLLDE